MTLKTIVDGLLKKKNRPLNWLAREMKKTDDGLKLSLVRESIKYADIVTMSRILEVSPLVFFETEDNSAPKKLAISTNDPEAKPAHKVLKQKLENAEEMLAVLRQTLKDREMIINLLGKRQG